MNKWLILLLCIVSGYFLYQYYKRKQFEAATQQTIDATRGRGYSSPQKSVFANVIKSDVGTVTRTTGGRG